FLRFDAGRYGTAALEQLAARTEGPQAESIAARAAQALRTTSRLQIAQALPQVTPARRAGNIAVIFPSDGKLPQQFLEQDRLSSSVSAAGLYRWGRQMRGHPDRP